jgi:DHA2 family multidrug resistance protein-like MFS transporter
MDLTVLNLAVPSISAALRPSASQLLWMIDIYGFLVAGFLITMGTLGDRIGRRRLLLIGGGAFGLASAIAAFSRSAEMLVVMRALLGVAGATLAPSTLSLIRNMFRDEEERRFAIGVWVASYSAGGAIGPLFGGVLLAYFGWGSVFWIAVPVMVLLLVLGPRLLPEYRDPNAGTVDLVSVAQSLFAVLSVIYALKRFAEYGYSAVATGLLVAGLAVAWLFVRRQGRLSYPLLDTALFGQARFSGAIAAYGASCLAMFGVYIFVTQYLQLVLGLPPLRAGLATIPWSLAFVVASLLAPRLARRWAPQAVLIWGFVATAGGFVLLALAHGPYALGLIVISTVIIGVCLSPAITIGNEMIITSAPSERAGAASALSETCAEFSGALGIAVFGSLGTVLYRRALGEALPDGIPGDLASDALSTLGGAVAAASALGPQAGDALLTAARAAFGDALRITAFAGAVILLVAAVVAARLLRGSGTAKPAAE